MGSPGGRYWCQMLLRVPTVYKTGLGQTDGTQQLAQTAGAPGNGWEQSDSRSQAWDLTFPKASAGLGTVQGIITVQEMWCQAASAQAKTNAKDTAGSAKAGPSFSIFCPSILQGKGSLSHRDQEEPGSGFVKAAEESPLSSQRSM